MKSKKSDIALMVLTMVMLVSIGVHVYIDVKQKKQTKKNLQSTISLKKKKVRTDYNKKNAFIGLPLVLDEPTSKKTVFAPIYCFMKFAEKKGFTHLELNNAVLFLKQRSGCFAHHRCFPENSEKKCKERFVAYVLKQRKIIAQQKNAQQKKQGQLHHHFASTLMKTKSVSLLTRSLFRSYLSYWKKEHTEFNDVKYAVRMGRSELYDVFFKNDWQMRNIFKNMLYQKMRKYFSDPKHVMTFYLWNRHMLSSEIKKFGVERKVCQWLRLSSSILHYGLHPERKKLWQKKVLLHQTYLNSKVRHADGPRKDYYRYYDDVIQSQFTRDELYILEWRDRRFYEGGKKLVFAWRSVVDDLLYRLCRLSVSRPATKPVNH